MAAPHILGPALRLATLASFVAFAPVCARADEAGSAHRSWRDCLGQAFVTRAALSGRDLAADAALRECRAEEAAYLDALGASPLLDAEDIVRARPALAAQARAQLLALTGPRSVLR